MHVVAGVEDDQDRRVAAAPAPGRAQPFHHRAQLLGGHRGGVIGRPQAHRIQHRRPARRPALQGGDQLIGPAGDPLPGRPPPPVDVAEQPIRAGLGVRAQPRRDVDGQHDPPAEHPRQRQPHQRLAQPGGVHLAAVDRVVERAVAPTMLRCQAQPDQRAHRPLGAQHGVDQLEQLIGPPAQASIQLAAEPVQLHRRQALVCADGTAHTVHHGHRRSPWSVATRRIQRWPPSCQDPNHPPCNSPASGVKRQAQQDRQMQPRARSPFTVA